MCLIRGVEGLYLSIRASQLKLLKQLLSAAHISQFYDLAAVLMHECWTCE